MESFQSGGGFRKNKTGTYVIIGVIVALILAGAVFWLAGPKIFGENEFTGAATFSGVEPEEDTYTTSSTYGSSGYGSYGSTESPVTSQSPNGMYTQLSLDAIPTIKKDVKVNSIDLKFTDLSTQIKVNTEKLELNYLRSVDMVITNFVGKLAVDGSTISIEGTAGKIKVNDIVVSNNLKISFSNLNYDAVSAEGIIVESLTATKGVGTLDVQDSKLVFKVENDPLTLNAFTGNFGFDKSLSIPATLNGYTEEIGVGGELPFVLK